MNEAPLPARNEPPPSDLAHVRAELGEAMDSIERELAQAHAMLRVATAVDGTFHELHPDHRHAYLCGVCDAVDRAETAHEQASGLLERLAR